MKDRISEAQRKAILKRDNFDSQFLHLDPNGNYTTACDICPFKKGERKLNVHHIKPNRIAEDGGNTPENLLTVYQCTHTGKKCNGQLVHGERFVIHPDVREATDKFRKGNKQAFTQMGHDRNQKVARGEEYWDSEHDGIMKAVAEHRTEQAKKKGWVWPFKKQK